MSAPAGIPARTQVAIVGAGPAGLLLSQLLRDRGVDAVVLERGSREKVEARQRAGMLEHGAVQALREVGAADRLDREGLVHDGIELRFEGRRVRVDLQGLTGAGIVLYAQTEVVRDLVALRRAQDEPLLFDAEVTELAGLDGDAPRVRYRHDGVVRELAADVVVGADGFHGPSRRAIPDGAGRTYERAYPYAWLGILADAPPPSDEVIYARHERGFALGSMRGPQISRCYLQVPPGTDPQDWSHEAIWDELDRRFATDDGPGGVSRGPITAVSVTPMRSVVLDPMRHGRLFLVGDAAHIVPPTGAKGLNLAVADVRLLADALERWYAAGDPAGLDGYSASALARVWRAQQFAVTMTTMLHPDPTGDPFAEQLALAHLRLVATSEAERRSIAENYRGPDLRVG